MPSSPTYRVWFENPHEHRVTVEVHFAAERDDPALHIPSWTPGSYLLREYGRHLEAIAARVDDDPRRVTKLAKSSWQIAAASGEAVTVTYSLYAHELSVRTPHVDGTHAFVVGAAVFAWVDDLAGRPHELTVEPPAGWSAYSTLAESGSGPGWVRFRADDYDHLADAVVEAGPDHRVIDLEVLGVPHRVVIWGRGEVFGERLVADMARLIEVNAGLFGGALPYDRYLFVLLLSDAGQGGLEHRDGCALQWPRHKLGDQDYPEFLRLLAHEHFHVWNVKRIRPRGLGPFDYLGECYTRALWAMEGITSYYDQRQLLAAGLLGPERYLELTAERIETLEGVPGRRRRSLEEASFDAWNGLYKPNEQTPNASVSYYLLGGLVTLVFDLEIRRATEGKRSFDDVMAALWSRYLADPQRGLPDEAFKEAIIAVGGPILAGWVEAYVEGTREIDWEHHLGAVGLMLNREEAPPGPRLGILRRDEGDRVVVASVLADGPNAGLNLYPGDEIAAVDGLKVTPQSWSQVLRLLPTRGDVDLALFRRGELVLTRGRLAPRPGRPRIVLVENAGNEARQLRSQWLGDAF